MENLISTVWVIESEDCGIEPVIYLRGVQPNMMNEKVHTFNNPFEARNFIREHLGEGIFVVVTKETCSQAHVVNE